MSDETKDNIDPELLAAYADYNFALARWTWRVNKEGQSLIPPLTQPPGISYDTRAEVESRQPPLRTETDVPFAVEPSGESSENAG